MIAMQDKWMVMSFNQLLAFFERHSLTLFSKFLENNIQLMEVFDSFQPVSAELLKLRKLAKKTKLSIKTTSVFCEPLSKSAT